MRNQGTKDVADWTIMVYMVADSILANFAVESLKQLKRAAGNGVIVAAQFDVNSGPKPQKIRQFVFDGTGRENGSIDDKVVATLPASLDMLDPKSLTRFIDSVYARRECRARHYALVLWGHGPELLDEAPNPKSNKRTNRFLSPLQLQDALKNSKLAQQRKKFDIVAMDACSMSMVEAACQLQDCALFLIASQEEVPDSSFPYDRLLPHFRRHKDDVAEICKSFVKEYRQVYRDYIFTPVTDLGRATLSAIHLEDLKPVTRAIRDLAGALGTSAAEQKLRLAVLAARAQSRGFVDGLFVDIYDFCRHLCEQLRLHKAATPRLVEACARIYQALGMQAERRCLVANMSMHDSRCHGLSLYFPFFTDKEMQQAGVPLVKGGTDVIGKGGTDVIGKGGTDVIGKLRRLRIQEFEAYYGLLELSQKTGWGNFITGVWSRILAEERPGELDARYSAQQCAHNLLGSLSGPGKSPKTTNGHMDGKAEMGEHGYPPSPSLVA